MEPIHTDILHVALDITKEIGCAKQADSLGILPELQASNHKRNPDLLAAPDKWPS